MMIMRAASMLGRIRQACHYGSLVMKGVTGRSLLMTWLALRIIGTEMHGENFKEGSILVSLVGASIVIQISRMKFL